MLLVLMVSFSACHTSSESLNERFTLSLHVQEPLQAEGFGQQEKKSYLLSNESSDYNDYCVITSTELSVTCYQLPKSGQAPQVEELLPTISTYWQTTLIKFLALLPRASKHKKQQDVDTKYLSWMREVGFELQPEIFHF